MWKAWRTSKTYFCNTCDAESFKSYSHLKTHKIIHTRSKTYCCNTCNESFKSYSHIKTHKIIHTGPKTYFCNTCNESFNSYSHIKTHQIIHMSNVSWSGVCLCVDGQYTDWATLGMYWTLFLVFGNFFGFLVLFWFWGFGELFFSGHFYVFGQIVGPQELPEWLESILLAVCSQWSAFCWAIWQLVDTTVCSQNSTISPSCDIYGHCRLYLGLYSLRSYRYEIHFWIIFWILGGAGSNKTQIYWSTFLLFILSKQFLIWICLTLLIIASKLPLILQYASSGSLHNCEMFLMLERFLPIDMRSIFELYSES